MRSGQGLTAHVTPANLEVVSGGDFPAKQECTYPKKGAHGGQSSDILLRAFDAVCQDVDGAIVERTTGRQLRMHRYQHQALKQR